ncbi:methyl-CpG-binding domain-containing protein 9 isoform X2 [Solanum pennellii]|uniref:Methyl-CpG-binding domain-containing protein 9 isoform X2 n=1 Tax=Solanum pennellii TaxID=28526 RepID=A0ABM1GUR7_SOLPN|nr:methyl-CpG-binding domain-containing protein 9 isoform X2 [Solanum pennellii]
MDCSSNLNRALSFHIDLNETPLPSPREIERGLFIEHPESSRAKSVLTPPSQTNVRVCSSCEIGSSWRKDEQKEEWKCFKCVLSGRRRSSDDGSSGAGGRGGAGGSEVVELDMNSSPPLDMNVSPPREPEGEGLFQFVDLNEDLPVAGRELEQNHGAKVQAMKSPCSTGHSFNAPTSSFLAYRENGFKIQKASSLTGDIHKSQLEDMVLHRPHSDKINRSITDPVVMYDLRNRAGHFTAKKYVHQDACEVYLQDLKEYIARMNGKVQIGWHVDFEYCDQRCQTYAVYVGPDGSRFESLDDVARHMGLHHSMEVENGGNNFTSFSEGLPNIPGSKEAFGSAKTHKPGQSWSSPGRSLFHNGGSIFKCTYPSDGFPVEYQDFVLVSAGNVDPRPFYHSSSEIWPVGYLSSWHDRITGSLFACEVADGGDAGPVFKVKRYPCILHSVPTGSTVLLKFKSDSHIGEDNVENGNSATSTLVDEESISIQLMLEECNPPDLISDSHTAENMQKAFCGKFGNIGEGDSIGEFVVEGRSPSSVWEIVSQTLLQACIDAYKKKGVIQFCCTHDVYKMDKQESSEVGSLTKFSYLGAPPNFPRLVQSNSELKNTCEMLVKWLEQNRIGLDVDFVQEIIEQLPGVSACSNYKIVTKRKHKTTLQTVGNGFLQAKRKNHMQDEREAIESLRISGTLRKHLDNADVRRPCSSGKPLSTKIPAFLIGDTLQVWEFLLRFSEVLGLKVPFLFEEIEEELVSPWIDKTSSMEMPAIEIQDVREITLARGGIDSLSGRFGFHQNSRYAGVLLTKIHGLLLKALVTELLSKVAVYVDSNIGTGGSKSRRGRKKDPESLATVRKSQLDMLPINQVTWPEIARRYMLALLAMDVNMESAEIACKESGRVFHCLQGDGGPICGALSGVAALEADAMLLAEATKQIFGSLKSGNIFVSVDEKESDAKGADAENGQVPEWAKALEPVRKLPTNVGARIRKCVNMALEKDPPEWARKALMHSISKEVYKGNASGPTKRAVISLLAEVNRGTTSPKPEKEEKVKSPSTVSDLIMKQCRIILRRAVKEDKDKVFCNLSGRTVLSPNDNDNEGLLGHPAMVSRPLDFRTIDVKLAAGSYGGSHESFIDEVREVWHNIRTAYCNKSNLLELAGSLLQKFEEDYEKERIFLLKFLCGEMLSSAILRDHIDRSASLSAELQQKLRSLGAELKLLKHKKEILTAKLKNDARSSGDAGSDTSIWSNDCKLKVQGPDSGSHNSSISGGCRQLDDGTQHNKCNDFNKQSCLYTSKIIQDKTCASGTNHIRNSPDPINHLQHQQLLKENARSLNTSSHAKCGTEETNLQNDLFMSTTVQQETDQIPGNRLESAQSSSKSIMLFATHIVSATTCLGSVSNPLEEALLFEMSAIKKEIRALEDSIAAKELDLQEVSVRKEYMGQDSEGRLYWTFGRSTSSRLVAYASTSTQPESSGHLWSYGVESSRRSGVLDSSAPWENMGLPNLDQWTSYQSDVDTEILIRWLKEHDPRERELKESILQWRDTRKMIYYYLESHGHDTVGLNTSIPSEDSASCFNSDSLVTRAVTAIKKMVSGCSTEEETEICTNLGVKVRVSFDGELYRCECLEPLWTSRPHCLSCHQTFSDAKERQKHANEKCRIDSSIQRDGETSEQPVKRKRKANNEILQDNSLSTIDCRRDKHGNAPASAENQTKQECPFKLEEIKAQFITQSSLKELVNEIGLIGCNGTPSFVPGTSPYLCDSALGLLSQREDEVCGGNSTDLLSSEHQLRNGVKFSRINNSDKPNCTGNGLAGAGPVFGRLKSATKRGRDKFSSTKDKILEFGVNMYFVIPESSLHPVAGRASVILRCLKINLLDIDAALPEEALRVSRLQPERRRVWRAFVKSAATVYEMVQATIILEDAIKTEYLKNDWWYWSSPSAAARNSTLSALALRVYALDSAILYDKLSSQDASETDCKEEREPPRNSVPTNTASPSKKKPLDPEPAESSRPKGCRTSKRRKDSGNS